ncbi:MAG: hypothetical protein KBD78_10355 [Oligoflexales bacterium]|nr:hypothetical protein [Oligoflexales bacterium]
MKLSFNLLRTSVWCGLFLLATNCGVDSKRNSGSSDLKQTATLLPGIPSSDVAAIDMGFATTGATTSGRSSSANVSVAVYPINQLAGEVVISEASTWVAEYFNNYQFDNYSWPQVLPANPYAKPSQLGNDLELNWGDTSPAYGINKDYYSARFTALIKVRDQGTLRFKFNSDDGSRAYIHSQHESMVGKVNPTSYLTASDRRELWNHWREKAADKNDNDGQVFVYPGYYVITIEYYERAGGAELKFAAGSTISTPLPVSCQPNEYKASFYHGNYIGDMSASAANLPAQTPVVQQCIPDLKTGLKTEIQQTYLDGQPRYDLRDNYTAYYEKKLFVEKLVDTAYRMEFRADDDLKIFIDRRLVAEYSLSHGDRLQVLDIVLRPGAHDIVLKMYENTGIASVNFKLVPIDAPPPPPPVSVGPGVNDALLPDSCGGSNWTRYVINGTGHKFNQGTLDSSFILERDLCLFSPDMSINQDITAPIMGPTIRTTYYARKVCCAATFNFQLKADDRAWVYVNGQLQANYDLDADRGNFKTIQISTNGFATIVVVVEDDGGKGLLNLQRF